MMTRRFVAVLEPQILKHYAIASTVLFTLLMVFIVIKVPFDQWLSFSYLEHMEWLSKVCLLTILGSSLMGVIFHHLVSSRQRARNTFAFVFSFTLIKFLGTLAFFQVVI